MSAQAAPVGGRVATRSFLSLVAVAVVGALILAWRFVAGLGAATAMNDGYPWGVWIAWDVVVGTALACGGYAMALLVYVLNRGRYHPLVRSAVLTSALGYTLAGVSVVFDLGRWWKVWQLPVRFTHWNGESVLLEVALCIMLYTLVLWVELSPAVLERWRTEARSPRLRAFAERASGPLEKALPWIIALGVLLPTMHQSSLGGLLLLAGHKLHPLWQTPLLPLLFLLTAFGIGFAAVTLEAVLASAAFGRPLELHLLRGLARPAAQALWAFLVVRVADVALRGHLARVVTDWQGAVFLVELALVGWAAWLLGRPDAGVREDARRLFRAALFAAAGGSLYRIATFLVAYDPGHGWRYFPSVGELLVTTGIVAGEIALYLYFVRRFPVLPVAAPRRVAAPPAGAPGVPTLVPAAARGGPSTVLGERSN